MFTNPIRRAAVQSMQRKAILTGARIPGLRATQTVNFRAFSKQSKPLNKPNGYADNFANGTSAVYVD